MFRPPRRALRAEGGALQAFAGRQLRSEPGSLCLPGTRDIVASSRHDGELDRPVTSMLVGESTCLASGLRGTPDAGGRRSVHGRPRLHSCFPVREPSSRALVQDPPRPQDQAECSHQPDQSTATPDDITDHRI
jgi:hypothetical protein